MTSQCFDAGKHERGEALGEIFARASAWLAQETSTAPSSSDDSEELEIPDGAHRALKVSFNYELPPVCQSRTDL